MAGYLSRLRPMSRAYGEDETIIRDVRGCKGLRSLVPLSRGSLPDPCLLDE